MNIPIDRVKQLQDIYIFETAINQTITNIQKKKKNYKILSFILLTLLIASIIWCISTFKYQQQQQLILSGNNQQQQHEYNNNNIDNTIYNEEINFQNRDNQSSNIKSEQTKLTAFEYSILLLPASILSLSLTFSLIIYFSIDDPFLFITRCNSTLYLFNIYYCFSNKKIMILPKSTTQQMNYQTDTGYNNHNNNYNNNNNTNYNQNEYTDENDYNHRGNRLIPNPTSTIQRNKKFDNNNNTNTNFYN